MILICGLLGMHISGYKWGDQPRVFPVERSPISYGESGIFGYRLSGVDIVSSAFAAGLCSLTTHRLDPLNLH
jgi:hypothetical protein